MSAEHCRGPNHSLSLRRQEHFGLHESQVYEKKKKKKIIYIKRNTLSVMVCNPHSLSNEEQFTEW